MTGNALGMPCSVWVSGGPQQAWELPFHSTSQAGDTHGQKLGIYAAVEAAISGPLCLQQEGLEAGWPLRQLPPSWTPAWKAQFVLNRNEQRTGKLESTCQPRVLKLAVAT